MITSRKRIVFATDFALKEVVVTLWGRADVAPLQACTNAFAMLDISDMDCTLRLTAV